MRAITLAFCCLLAATSPLQAGDQSAALRQPPAPHPMAAFERLVGSRWQLEASVQEFEWGVGRQSVRARSYFVVDGEPRLVSEGMWYWHPAERQIRGIFTAVDMPVVLFDYTTRFEGSTMVNDLRSYGPDGVGQAYLETWEFLDDGHYLWKLLRQSPDGLQEEMSGTYTRQPPAPASSP